MSGLVGTIVDVAVAGDVDSRQIQDSSALSASTADFSAPSISKYKHSLENTRDHHLHISSRLGWVALLSEDQLSCPMLDMETLLFNDYKVVGAHHTISEGGGVIIELFGQPELARLFTIENIAQALNAALIEKQPDVNFRCLERSEAHCLADAVKTHIFNLPETEKSWLHHSRPRIFAETILLLDNSWAEHSAHMLGQVANEIFPVVISKLPPSEDEFISLAIFLSDELVNQSGVDIVKFADSLEDFVIDEAKHKGPGHNLLSGSSAYLIDRDLVRQFLRERSSLGDAYDFQSSSDDSEYAEAVPVSESNSPLAESQSSKSEGPVGSINEEKFLKIMEDLRQRGVIV